MGRDSVATLNEWHWAMSFYGVILVCNRSTASAARFVCIVVCFALVLFVY